MAIHNLPWLLNQWLSSHYGRVAGRLVTSCPAQSTKNTGCCNWRLWQLLKPIQLRKWSVVCSQLFPETSKQNKHVESFWRICLDTSSTLVTSTKSLINECWRLQGIIAVVIISAFLRLFISENNLRSPKKLSLFDVTIEQFGWTYLFIRPIR